MKLYKSVIAVILIAGSVFAANTNQVSSAAGKHPLPASVQKAMDQSKEISKLSKQLAKEKDSEARESLLNEIRNRFSIYSEQMDKADQERIEEFDAQREKIIEKMADARVARQQRIDSFMQTLNAQSPAE